MARATAAHGLLLGACALAVLTLCACSIDPKANSAFGCKGCTSTCMMGFCLRLGGDDGDDAGTPGDDGGLGSSQGDGGPGAGDGGVTPPPPPEDCSEPG